MQSTQTFSYMDTLKATTKQVEIPQGMYKKQTYLEMFFWILIYWIISFPAQENKFSNLQDDDIKLAIAPPDHFKQFENKFVYIVMVPFFFSIFFVLPSFTFFYNTTYFPFTLNLFDFHSCHLPMLYIGLEYGLTNNSKLAERFFSQALSIAPEDPFVIHEVAVVAFQNGE